MSLEETSTSPDTKLVKRNMYSAYLAAKLKGFQTIPTEHHAFPTGYSIDNSLDISATAFKLVNDLRSTNNISDVDLGSFQCLETMYLREVWVTECSTDNLTEGQTEEVAFCAIEGGPQPEFVAERTWQKVVNIHTAMKYLGITVGSASSRPVTFSVDLIRCTHANLGAEIIENAGKFRTTEVGAAGTAVVYLSSTKVAARLNALVNFVIKALSEIVTDDHKHRLKCALSITALFFSEFLYIHPFSNGNGRCARLLVNYMLAPYCVVPISIFFSINRKEYLGLLVDSQQYNVHGGLLVLFLLSMHRCATYIQYLLLSDD